MKKAFQFKAIATFVIAFLISATAMAQGGKVPASPRETVTGSINGANITIDYGSPAAKGRKIYGELVPYGKMWRAGANEATKFTTDKEITVEGKKLPAGSYSVFVTLTDKDAVVTFNSQVGQWGIKGGGIANEDPTKDVIAVTVKTKSAPMAERLKYVISSKGSNWFGIPSQYQ
ncbi:DUF2911 domain-containing protein [Mucilaginibacter antarcticus]|uniref:DUF2911 domain-containing protein n=1 Tax=Mucilaginibacter antarcticus TaxID=1855725 RepID=UPI003634D8B9